MMKRICQPFAILAPAAYLVAATGIESSISRFGYWALATLFTELLMYAMVIIEDKYK